MKFIEVHARIKKINKFHLFPCQNHENHIIFRISLPNHEKHENVIIQLRNNENHEILRIQRYNHENQEMYVFPMPE